MPDYIGEYEIRARLIPALLAVMPAVALAAVLIAWKDFNLTDAIVSLAILILVVVFADLARRAGRAIEPSLYFEMGGKPSVVFLRHRDSNFDPESKKRYLFFLARKLQSKAPTAAQEDEHPHDADVFYERCSTWLRERTRDTNNYRILFLENCTYGFRRNLLGIKYWGLALNVVIVLASLFCLVFGPFELFNLTHKQFGIIFMVAAVHALFFMLGVNKRGVFDASRTYGRQLILSCEGQIANDETTGSFRPTARR